VHAGGAERCSVRVERDSGGAPAAFRTAGV